MPCYAIYACFLRLVLNMSVALTTKIQCHFHKQYGCFLHSYLYFRQITFSRNSDHSSFFFDNSHTISAPRSKEQSFPRDWESFALVLSQKRTQNWRNSPTFSVCIRQKSLASMVLRLQRVSAEQVGPGAQLKFLFEPLCEQFPWNS